MKRRSVQYIAGLVLLILAGVFFSRRGSLTSAPDARAKTPKGVVVLDAGHGGKDPGKVGVGGQLEKDINLQIVLRIKLYLEMNDIQVILTRESDDGLYRLSDSNKKSADMRRRIEIINEVMPDVMVSIHQNSYHESEIRGAQVFYYQNSEKGKAFAQIM